MDDPYNILGVEPSANDGEIREAHRRLVWLYHPDRLAGAPAAAREEAAKRIKAVNAAYDVLSDSTRRRQYDATRGSGQAAPGSRKVVISPQAMSLPQNLVQRGTSISSNVDVVGFDVPPDALDIECLDPSASITNVQISPFFSSTFPARLTFDMQVGGAGPRTIEIRYEVGSAVSIQSLHVFVPENASPSSQSAGADQVTRNPPQAAWTPPPRIARPANLPIRFFSALFDIAVMFVAMLVACTIPVLVSDNCEQPTANCSAALTSTMDAWILIAFFAIPPLFLALAYRSGFSLGARIFGLITLTREIDPGAAIPIAELRSARPFWLRAAVRACLTLASLWFLGIPFLPGLFNRRRRTLPDVWSGTFVYHTAPDKHTER